MIIQCDKCKARFKLADDKISPKGVRVRCTKCEHTFVVRRAIEEQEVEVDPERAAAEAAAEAELAALIANPAAA
ncbi:MAG: zinc-ribbon domain-containing protein, partial [Deltaproteobacteria bacterium]|nr:zinc-ribbon domain-containing protein [Deltaproteobacteria bacterium]